MSEGESNGPLAGVKVVDVGQLVQAPQAAQLMVDLGAEVIKVELPRMGDMSRWIPIDRESDLRSGYVVGCNRGKRSITLDLHHPDAQAVFLDLVDWADVVLSNFLPGTLERFNIGYEAASARNPRVIYGTASAYGSKGADADREGADIGGQAAGGVVSRIATNGGSAVPIGVTMADHIGSLDLFGGVVAALFARERTGRGQLVEVSLYGGQIFAQASELSVHLLSGADLPPPDAGHALLHAIYGIFPTADGHIAVVGVPPPVKDAFFAAIGRAEYSDDERYAAMFIAVEDKPEVFAAVSEALRARTTDEWADVFREIGVRYAPVRDYAAIVADPGAWENGYLQTVDHPEWGEVATIGTPIRLSDTPAVAGRIAPELGQHTEEILLELGHDWDAISAFRENGVT